MTGNSDWRGAEGDTHTHTHTQSQGTSRDGIRNGNGSTGLKPTINLASLNRHTNRDALSKFFKDAMGGKRALNTQHELDRDEFSPGPSIHITPDKRAKHGASLQHTTTSIQGNGRRLGG